MITTIYTFDSCYKCEKVKKLYPEINVIRIEDLSDDESHYIFNKASEIGLLSAPIVLDENGNVILHKELGIC